MTVCATGRSLPEMNACTTATSILINFCKYPVTTAKSWYPEYMDELFTVMLNWCDKETPLFPYLCTLIWMFAHNPDYKAVILQISNVKYRMERIKNLVMRKQHMVDRSRTKAVSYFVHYKALPLPSLKPDWGLDYKDRPRTFTNAVHAYESVARILDLA